MASKPADLSGEVTFFALTGTGATDVYTVVDEELVFLLSVTVTDSTGAVATAATVSHRSGGVNRVLVPATFGLPSATENLEITGEPIVAHMIRGDSVRVTGASGHHCFVSVQPIRSTGALQQR